MLRISKNKAVCLKALIQNGYHQLALKKQAQKQAVLTKEVDTLCSHVVEIIKNQNYALMYVVDMLNQKEWKPEENVLAMPKD